MRRAMHDRLAATISIALASACSGASADVFMVTRADDSHESGTLRSAIALANSANGSGVIQFAPQLNGSTITLSSGLIEIDASMLILGPGTDKLTISGNDASRIFSVPNPGSMPMHVALASLTLSHATGAVYTRLTALTMTDVVITSSNGGALQANGGFVALNKVIMQGNSGGCGGAFKFESVTDAQIVDSVISGNTAAGANCGGGGGYAYGSKIVVSRTVFAANHATHAGGALGIVGGYLRVVDSVIHGNSADGDGGAINLRTTFRGGDARIEGSRLYGNVAQSGGAVSLGNFATLQLKRSTVSGNQADLYGGGIDAGPNTAYVGINYSLFSGNSITSLSGGGGGLALRSGNPTTVYNSTFYGNYAYRNGGAIGIFGAASGDHLLLASSTIVRNAAYDDSSGIFADGTPAINSCIVADNASHLTTQDLAGSFKAMFSLIKTPGTATIAGSTNLAPGTDPALGPLAPNGGPTWSLLPAPGSAVIGAGDPGISPTYRDQRGLPRVANGRADIGAVERQSAEEIIFRDGFGA